MFQKYSWFHRFLYIFFHYTVTCQQTKNFKATREDMPMQITDIKIRKFFDDGPMKAVVSVTFNDALAVHDIKVIHARERYFIVMPSRKNPDGTYRDIVHPINSEFRAALLLWALIGVDVLLLYPRHTYSHPALYPTQTNWLGYCF